MLKEIIINVEKSEVRVAIMENKQIVELLIDRIREPRINGNIYKGRINNILPGMQAAFVDIGLSRNAFLYVSDIANDIDEYREFMNAEGQEDLEEIDYFSTTPSSRRKMINLQIEDILKKGQEILVQITKEPIEKKGARVTTHITLPGRYLVLMPMVEHIGISRRIENLEERERLRDIIKKIKPSGMGIIVRTVAESTDEEALANDMNFLIKLWERVQHHSSRCSASCLIHEDLGIIYKVIRDSFTPEVSSLIVDSQEEYDKIINFVESLMPELKSHIKLYTRPEPIWEVYGIEEEMQKALDKKVKLKCGGHIIIEETEALISIDVNTGKYVGKRSLEETVLKTNLEAAQEIAYQLRLRDVGGIIIIDFIDMEKQENREKVIQKLTSLLKNDRARTNILQLTDLGLVEMTRKRVKQSLNRLLCQPCPYCNGRGTVKSLLTTSLEVLRRLKKICSSAISKNIIVKLNSEVAKSLLEEDYDQILVLQKKFDKQIDIQSNPDFHIEQIEIVAG
ncbi:MAG: Rne/Rng family ribonuclease [Candidatus Firestonebacteria bacterium]|nr:Rne/Rng family ribonuclease [Candidatus Firestonebacteria bacterium]